MAECRENREHEIGTLEYVEIVADIGVNQVPNRRG